MNICGLNYTWQTFQASQVLLSGFKVFAKNYPPFVVLWAMHPNMGCGWTSVKGISVMMIKLLNDAALFCRRGKVSYQAKLWWKHQNWSEESPPPTWRWKGDIYRKYKINACFWCTQVILSEDLGLLTQSMNYTPRAMGTIASRNGQ